MSDCFWHGTEPIPPGAYKVCGECGHCWLTEAEFMGDVNAMLDDLDAYARSQGWPLNERSADPSQQFFCPLCTHDF